MATSCLEVLSYFRATELYAKYNTCILILMTMKGHYKWQTYMSGYLNIKIVFKKMYSSRVIHINCTKNLFCIDGKWMYCYLGRFRSIQSIHRPKYFPCSFLYTLLLTNIKVYVFLRCTNRQNPNLRFFRIFNLFLWHGSYGDMVLNIDILCFVF